LAYFARDFLSSSDFHIVILKVDFNPFKDEAQAALFKDPVRTAL
jgi:hypothetical protein